MLHTECQAIPSPGKKITVVLHVCCPRLYVSITLFFGRALSSSRLHELAAQSNDSYGATYQTSAGGNLDIPGGGGGKHV